MDLSNDRATILPPRVQELLAKTLNDAWSGSPDQQQILLEPWDALLYAADGTDSQRSGFRNQYLGNGNTELRIGDDTAGRYPTELLQNAQDACADSGIQGSVWFAVTPTALLVANQGIPFDKTQIAALTSLGSSSKQPTDKSHRTIGYKGIGFTAVFEVTETPQIISQGIAFGFDRDLATRCVSTLLDLETPVVAARYFPFPLDPSAWADDRALVERLLSEGAVTVIRLPWREGITAERVRDDLLTTLSASTLLLMPALRSIIVVDHRRWTRQKPRPFLNGRIESVHADEGHSEQWFVANGRFPVDAASTAGLHSKLWNSVQDIGVTVAFPWSRRGPKPPETDYPLHAYFPTTDRLGRGFLAHGDFYLEDNRKHIQEDGAGGAVSQCVGEALIELTVTTVLGLVGHKPEWAPALLQCLAERRDPDGFGEWLAERLDERLQDQHILPTCAGPLVTPMEARLLNADLTLKQVQALTALMLDTATLVLPEIECDVTVATWLQENLKVKAMRSADVLAQLSPERGPGYDATVNTVASWWGQLESVDRVLLPSTLRKLPLLQDAEGTWSTDDEVSIPQAGVPALPTGLSRRTYQPPKTTEARQFLSANFAIQELSACTCINIVLKAVREAGEDYNGLKPAAIHDFFVAIFNHAPELLKECGDRGLIPVPTIRAGTEGPREWRHAKQVYFSKYWVKDEALETLYGPFGNSEFLAPPRSNRQRTKLRPLYELLGVETLPRNTDVSRWRWPRLAKVADWFNLPDVLKAHRCPDEHPQAMRAVDSPVMDRLVEILTALEPSDGIRAHALIRLLRKRGEPYGPAAAIHCTHRAHKKHRRNPAVGFQQWLLETSAWVPARMPDGRTLLVRPSLVWTRVDDENLKQCLPLATVPPKDAEDLRLPKMTSPEPGPLVAALDWLAEQNPDLNRVPPSVWDAALALTSKLAGQLQRGKQSAPPRPKYFPAERAGTRCWATTPALADILFPDSFELTTLPRDAALTDSWHTLAEAYRLPLVSDQIAVELHPATSQPPTSWDLNNDDRIVLTAWLHRHGLDLEATARRLGRLTILETDQLSATFRYGETQEDIRQQVRWTLTPDDDGTLTFVAPISDETRAEITDLLVGFLLSKSKNRDQADWIRLVVTAGTEVIRRLGSIPDAALKEAKAALNNYREPTGDPVVTPPLIEADTVTDETDQKEQPAGIRTTDTITTTQGSVSQPLPAQQNRPAGTPGPVRPAAHVEIVFSPADPPPYPRPSGDRLTGGLGGTGHSGAPSMSPEDRKDVETRAIDRAKAYALTEGWSVEDVQTHNKGWDLEFILPSGERWLVEVKGSGGPLHSFIITRNEREAAQRQQNFKLFLVTYVRDTKGDMYIVDNREWATNMTLEPMSWKASVGDLDSVGLRYLSWQQSDRTTGEPPTTM
jgi:hypothetical protein